MGSSLWRWPEEFHVRVHACGHPVAPMKIYLINPSHVSFGIGVITPRWLYVLASATPTEYGTPTLIDETLEAFDPVRHPRG